MKDISGIEFEVGDLLKVIKGAGSHKFEVGHVLKCIKDDGTSSCRFQNKDGVAKYYYNDNLQKL